VIIVNYNGRRFLLGCLNALELQTLPRYQFETILIDNKSRDGSPALVRELFPGVRVIEAGRNLGFAGANNLGVRLARGRHIVLLNPDTEVAPDWLARLLEAGTGDRVGGITSRLRFLDRPHLINSTGLIPYSDGRCGDRDVMQPVSEVDRPPGEVFGGSGASLLLTRGLLEDIGAFDESLFMYYEDADLAWRARLRGWRFIYAPESECRHACGGTASAGSPFMMELTERNRTWVGLQNAPPFEAVRAGIGLVLRAGRLAYRFVRGRYGVTIGHLRATARALGWVAGSLPWLMPARYEIRAGHRRCNDSVIRRFVESPPARSR
jgi:GT2 family glycosyltransferase